MIGRTIRVLACAVTCTSLLVGCFESSRPLRYLHDDEPVKYYRQVASEIDHPHLHTQTPPEVAVTGEPRTLDDRRRDEIWDMPLAEAIQIALANNEVIRVAGGLDEANRLLAGPDNAPSKLDPAIQQSNVLFGGRGVEAALSAFDTTFTTSTIWGRNEEVQNSPFNPQQQLGATQASETAAFNAALAKQFANGGTFRLEHEMNYLGVPPGLFLFPSTYQGNVSVNYRQPLWAGGGVDFTRIAGPTSPGLGGIIGVGQGVLIARINQDISLADFEASVRNLVRDVENTYWDLYLQYRLYAAATVARNSALSEWRRIKKIIDVGGLRVEGAAGAGTTPADEAQARDQYFANRAAAENALSQIYTAETRLRRLIGLPVNDGRIIRPADEPLTAPIDADWYAALTEALTRRVELRRQKWNVKSLELQLQAARSLVAPTLDLVSSYRVNAFGDKLLAYDDDDAVGTPQGLNSAYETLTQGNQTGWNLGFEFSMPLGFRFATTQVRNLELRVARAREVLSVQELEISHELAVAFQELARHYQTAKTNFNRRVAARRREELFREEVEAGVRTPDEVLRAQVSVAQAEQDYYTSLVQYNQAITTLLFRKGALLEANNVVLAEGAWVPEAYDLAHRRARMRTHALPVDDDVLVTTPKEVTHPFFAQEVELVAPPEELIPIPDETDELDGVAPGDDGGPPVELPPPSEPGEATDAGASTPAGVAPPPEPGAALQSEAVDAVDADGQTIQPGNAGLKFGRE